MLHKKEFHGRRRLIIWHIKSYARRMRLRIRNKISLIDNVVAYYDFATAAGEDVPDSHRNADTLRDNNFVQRQPGRHGNAADFDIETDNYFLIPSDLGSMFRFDGSFSVAFWLYVITPPSKQGGEYCYQIIMGRHGEFSIYNAAIGSAVAWIMYGGKAAHNLYSAGKWILFCAINDAENKRVQIWSSDSGMMGEYKRPYTFIDRGVTDTVTIVGRQKNGAERGRMLIDSLAVFDKALKPIEIEWIFNRNNGRAYAEYMITKSKIGAR